MEIINTVDIFYSFSKTYHTPLKQINRYTTHRSRHARGRASTSDSEGTFLSYNSTMTPRQKENVWYITAGIAALLVATWGEAAAVVFVPVVLVVALVGLWVFDMK